MKTAALLLLAAVLAKAQSDAHTKRDWAVSVTMLSAATAADIYSSRGAIELNPVLGRGPFGGRQVAIKLGLTDGLILAEWMISRNQPGRLRLWNKVNRAMSVVVAAAAMRNEAVR